SGLATPSFGARHLTSLEPSESGIRTLLGDSDFSLSLGALEARGDVRRSTTTLRVDYGVTRRFSVGLRVPYVEVVHDAQLVLNRDGTGANVGENPGLSSSAAFSNNSNVFIQLGAARTQLLE